MTLSRLARDLGRNPLWVSRIQRRFGIPLFQEYPATCLTFLRKVRDLMNLGVSEERLTTLWDLERTLIRLLYLAPVEDFSWMIAGCAAEGDPERRLLLSNADLGVPLLSRELQPGLDFGAGRPRELFQGQDMGEDALRVLDEYRTLLGEIRQAVAAELAVLRETLRWERTVALSC